QALRELAVRSGTHIPQKDIVLEMESSNTPENFEFSKPLLTRVRGDLGLAQDARPLRVAYLQTPLQQFRTKATFHRIYEKELNGKFIEGVSHSVPLAGREVADVDVAREFFRILLYSLKGDIIPVFGGRTGLGAVPGKYWSAAASLISRDPSPMREALLEVLTPLMEGPSPVFKDGDDFLNRLTGVPPDLRKAIGNLLRPQPAATPLTWGLWTRWFGVSPELAVRFVGPVIESIFTMAVFEIFFVLISILFPEMGNFYRVASAAVSSQLIFSLLHLTGVYVRDGDTGGATVVPAGDARAPPAWNVLLDSFAGFGLLMFLPYYFAFGFMPFLSIPVTAVLCSASYVAAILLHLTRNYFKANAMEPAYPDTSKSAFNRKDPKFFLMQNPPYNRAEVLYVGEMARLIAEKAGMSKEWQGLLLRAGISHDIGKGHWALRWYYWSHLRTPRFVNHLLALAHAEMSIFTVMGRGVGLLPWERKILRHHSYDQTWGPGEEDAHKAWAILVLADNIVSRHAPRTHRRKQPDGVELEWIKKDLSNRGTIFPELLKVTEESVVLTREFNQIMNRVLNLPLQVKKGKGPAVRIAVLQNHQRSGTHLIKFLKEFGPKNGMDLEVTVFSAWRGDLPNLDHFDGIVGTGSPHNVDELDAGRALWHKQEQKLLQYATEMGKPILGICFTHQNLAASQGGRVLRARHGFYFGRMNVTIEEPNDPLFAGVPPNVWMTEYHGREVTADGIPADFKRIASSEMTPVEGIRHKDPSKPVYGLQFHPEVDYVLEDAGFSNVHGRQILRNFVGIVQKDKEARQDKFLREYGVKVGWWLEDIFSSLAPALTVLIPGLGALSFVAILVLARVALIALHVRGMRGPPTLKNIYDQLGAVVLVSAVPFITFAFAPFQTAAALYVLAGFGVHLFINYGVYRQWRWFPAYPASLRLPERIGPYKVERELGRSSVSRVYLSADLDAQPVAVKAFNTLIDLQPGFGFEREKAVLEKLEGPQFPRLFTSGEHNSEWETQPYLVMEFVDGVTVSEALRSRRVGEPSAFLEAEAVQIIIDTLNALQKVHEAGYVHNDIKPGNIMLAREASKGFRFAKLIDFTSASDADRAGRPFREDGVKWFPFTEGYRPPEIAQGFWPGPASDVYQTALVLCKMLTGRLLSAEELEGDAMVSAPVRAVLVKALSARPEDRPSSAADMARELENAVKTSRKVRPYRILETFGQGSHSTVYKAVDPETSRPVAVKAYSPDTHGWMSFKMENEALRAVSQSTDPDASLLPRLITSFDEGDDFYNVLEPFEGVLLENLLDPGHPLHGEFSRLGLTDRLEIAIQLLKGLKAAHAAGYVHNDVKLGNIALAKDTDGKYRVRQLFDFSIASEARLAGLPSRGKFPGTKGYTSPEVKKGKLPGPASDIYLTGLVLSQLLAGRELVWSGELEKWLQESASGAEGRIPASVQAILRKALSEKPEDRFSSAAEMSLELEKAQTSVRSISPKPRQVRKGERGFITLDLLLSVSLVVSGLMKAVTRTNLSVQGLRWMRWAGWGLIGVSLGVSLLLLAWPAHLLWTGIGLAGGLTLALLGGGQVLALRGLKKKIEISDPEIIEKSLAFDRIIARKGANYETGELQLPPTLFKRGMRLVTAARFTHIPMAVNVELDPDAAGILETLLPEEESLRTFDEVRLAGTYDMEDISGESRGTLFIISQTGDGKRVLTVNVGWLRPLGDAKLNALRQNLLRIVLERERAAARVLFPKMATARTAPRLSALAAAFHNFSANYLLLKTVFPITRERRWDRLRVEFEALKRFVTERCGVRHRNMYAEDLVRDLRSGRSVQVAYLKVQNLKDEFNTRGEFLQVGHLLGSLAIREIGPVLRARLEREFSGTGIDFDVYNDNGPVFNVVFRRVGQADGQRLQAVLRKLLEEDSDFRREVIENVKKSLPKYVGQEKFNAIAKPLEELTWRNFNMYGGLSEAQWIPAAGDEASAVAVADALGRQAMEAAKYQQLVFDEWFDRDHLEGVVRKTVIHHVRKAKASQKSGVALYNERIRERISAHRRHPVMYWRYQGVHPTVREVFKTGVRWTALLGAYERALEARSAGDLSAARAELQKALVLYRSPIIQAIDRRLNPESRTLIFSGQRNFRLLMNHILRVKPAESFHAVFKLHGDEFGVLIWDGAEKILTIARMDATNTGAMLAQHGFPATNRTLDRQLKVIHDELASGGTLHGIPQRMAQSFDRFPATQVYYSLINEELTVHRSRLEESPFVLTVLDEKKGTAYRVYLGVSAKGDVVTGRELEGGRYVKEEIDSDLPDILLHMEPGSNDVNVLAPILRIPPEEFARLRKEKKIVKIGGELSVALDVRPAAAVGYVEVHIRKLADTDRDFSVFQNSADLMAEDVKNRVVKPYQMLLDGSVRGVRSVRGHSVHVGDRTELQPFVMTDWQKRIAETMLDLAVRGDQGRVAVTKEAGDPRRFIEGLIHLRDVWGKDVGGRKVVVFGGARLKPGTEAWERAEKFGAALARHGIIVMTGAGPGAMEAAPKGASQVNGGVLRTEGVKIKGIEKQETNPFIGRSSEQDDFHTRKAGLIHNGDGDAAVEGGFGTFDEFIEAMRGKAPMVFFGTGYWNPILETLEKKLVKAGFWDPAQIERPFVTDDPEEAVQYYLKKWQETGYRRIGFGRDVMDRMIQEAQDGSDRMDRWPDAVVFVGGDNVFPELRQMAEGLADWLDAEGVPVRAASRDAFRMLLPRNLKDMQLVAMLSQGDPEPTELELGVEKRVLVHDGPVHRHLLEKNALAYVFQPGNMGKLNVLFDILTQMQTGKIPRKPVILIGKYWKTFMDTLTEIPLSQTPPLISEKDRDLFRMVRSLEEAKEALKEIVVERKTSGTADILAPLLRPAERFRKAGVWRWPLLAGYYLAVGLWEEGVFRGLLLGETGVTWTSLASLDPSGLAWLAAGIALSLFSHAAVRWASRTKRDGLRGVGRELAREVYGFRSHLSASLLFTAVYLSTGSWLWSGIVHFLWDFLTSAAEIRRAGQEEGAVQKAVEGIGLPQIERISESLEQELRVRVGVRVNPESRKSTPDRVKLLLYFGSEEEPEETQFDEIDALFDQAMDPSALEDFARRLFYESPGEARDSLRVLKTRVLERVEGLQGLSDADIQKEDYSALRHAGCDLGLALGTVAKAARGSRELARIYGAVLQRIISRSGGLDAEVVTRKTAEGFHQGFGLASRGTASRMDGGSAWESEIGAEKNIFSWVHVPSAEGSGSAAWKESVRTLAREIAAALREERREKTVVAVSDASEAGLRAALEEEAPWLDAEVLQQVRIAVVPEKTAAATEDVAGVPRPVFSVDAVVEHLAKTSGYADLPQRIASGRLAVPLFSPLLGDWRFSDRYKAALLLLQIMGDMAVQISTDEFNNLKKEADLIASQA
ncbi:MAG: LOG family protein, partial [Elusimicrobia bacterium]|nr:LOG family protein [Elusimicrobiota bacterium]